MKVLLVSHAFSPGRGSEPGLGWNWAWYLSREHEIWALVVFARPFREQAHSPLYASSK